MWLTCLKCNESMPVESYAAFLKKHRQCLGLDKKGFREIPFKIGTHDCLNFRVERKASGDNVLTLKREENPDG